MQSKIFFKTANTLHIKLTINQLKFFKYLLQLTFHFLHHKMNRKNIIIEIKITKRYNKIINDEIKHVHITLRCHQPDYL
jgi:hypothetical protein